MAVLFKRNANEGGLDARIAELSARRGRFEPVPPQVDLPSPATATAAPTGPMPAAGATILPARPAAQPKALLAEQIAAAREELTARLNAEIRPERRAQLSRSDLAKLVDAAVHAYFIRAA